MGGSPNRSQGHPSPPRYSSSSSVVQLSGILQNAVSATTTPAARTTARPVFSASFFRTSTFAMSASATNTHPVSGTAPPISVSLCTRGVGRFEGLAVNGDDADQRGGFSPPVSSGRGVLVAVQKVQDARRSFSGQVTARGWPSSRD
jgi:hypothetical protein